MAFITAGQFHSRIFVTTPVPTVDDKYMKMFRFQLRELTRLISFAKSKSTECCMSCTSFTDEIDDGIPGTNFQRDIKHEGANHFDIVSWKYLPNNF